MERTGRSDVTTSILPLEFSRAWSAADAITGWLSASEAAALFCAAQEVPDEQLIVEVGAFSGRSTMLLAQTGKRILTIDPLPVGDSIGKTPIDASVVASLHRVVNGHDNVAWLRLHSTEVVLPPQSQIGLLYIDGRHKYPSPLEDFQHFAPRLAAGATVAFHDCGREHGVTQSIEELELAGLIRRTLIAGTMYIGDVL